MTIARTPMPDDRQRGPVVVAHSEDREDDAVRTLTHRDRAILRAVASGTAELVAGAEPDLYLDGLACSDQFAAHRLFHAGLITAAGTAGTGQRVTARLTTGGAAVLAA